jgi:ABC-type nitrate/sulfonate/bicarbonate transport system substrate-binding protein
MVAMRLPITKGRPMKLAVPDLISNSYFPAVAAVELGFFAREGLDVSLELVVPVEDAMAAMRDGKIEFIGCSAHLLVGGFPEWRGVKLLCAQSQGMYWFLVMRSDLATLAPLAPRRGDLSIVKGRTIGAAHWVGMGLRRLLAEAGIDAARDGVNITQIPGAHGKGMNFGVIAAQALEDRKVDGFWANGMGAEIAVRRGVGTVVLDARRAGGPGFNYTMAAVAATDALIARNPEAAAAAVRAIVRTQAALRRDVGLAAQVGAKLFPPSEAALIVDLVRRDLPYYDAKITPDFVDAMTQFSRDLGILKGSPSYADVVAIQFRDLWGGTHSDAGA